MKFEHVFSMIGGNGENSYANNSRLQEKAIFVVKPLLNEAVREICESFTEKIIVADLGCSSGPNTFLVLFNIINAISEHCCQSDYNRPEIQFFLNDLPSNDFNTVFQLSVAFKEQFREEKGDECVPFYIGGLPGSFYGRLFPSKSVHFFHSSYCLMWLSQVPKGLVGEDGSQLNSKGIYINSQSSPNVFHCYLEQFKSDFLLFPKARSKELIFGGSMILSFLGRRNNTSIGECVHLWGFIGEAINSMICEGLVDEEKLSTFNLPAYTPLMEEVKLTIDVEGSFYLSKEQIFESNWDPFDEEKNDFVEDKSLSGKNVAKTIRAVFQPLLASHFGNDIMDILFSRYAKYIASHMSKGKPKYVVFVLYLKLK